MSIKQLILLTAGFVLPSLAQAITQYQIGDGLVVHATNGLVLRKTPDAKGEKMATLDYSAMVTVQAENFRKKPHSVQEFKGFNIKGYWVKVKTEKNQEGYVFDGYLSKYSTPVKIEDDRSGNTLVDLYMLGHAERKGNRIETTAPSGYISYRQLFKNGAETALNAGEGGSSQVIVFEKGISMEEAWFIGKALWLKDMKTKAPTAAARNKISIMSADELYEVEVTNKAGITILTMSHAD